VFDPTQLVDNAYYYADEGVIRQQKLLPNSSIALVRTMPEAPVGLAILGGDLTDTIYWASSGAVYRIDNVPKP
jgi:hypothetical protein